MKEKKRREGRGVKGREGGRGQGELEQKQRWRGEERVSAGQLGSMQTLGPVT